GLDALRRIGLERQVMADALPMRGRMIHPVEGTPQAGRPDKTGITHPTGERRAQGPGAGRETTCAVSYERQ
ncbi:hypothetical protein ACFQ8Q_35980, partial [Streptomyces cyaneofuscatus]|uniref:hypothetical protein n=1 Tax=Streptomyces cyaneofuscatus TaxID=66883 RepID=UPI00367EC8CA